MHDPLAQDAEARRRIEEDLDTTFLVEAGAGSGKTTAMAARMIRLVQTGRAKAGEMAAITFTNKAAAELKTRFRLRLEQAWRESGDEAERERLAEAIRDLGGLFIGTIHAFCARLLRERPIEAGLDPDFAEMDESEWQAFRDACWDEWLNRLRDAGGEERFERLESLGITPEDLHAVYCRVCEYEDVAICRKPVPRPDFNVIRATLPRLVDEAYRRMPQSEPEKGWDALQSAVRQARRMLKRLDMSDDGNVLGAAKLFDRKINVTQNRWLDKDAAKAMKEAFEAWKAEVLEPFLRAWYAYVHPHAIEFVLPAVDFCRERRFAAGLANFQDLLLRATALLRDHPAARAYFARRIRYLLVDEFQDTDPVQAEMMLLLTGEDGKEARWRHLAPRPGSLFIVGDPKQSIYRFRRADISTYNEVKRIVERSGAVLLLTRNFRSTRAIGDFVNGVFRERFARDYGSGVRTEESGGTSLPGRAAGNTSVAEDVQAPYADMLTVQPNPSDASALNGVWRVNVPRVDYHRKEQIVAWDAGRIASWIKWACDGHLAIQERDAGGRVHLRPAEPGDFLILLKTRTHIAAYAETLERMGIRTETAGSRGRYGETVALLQLLRALDDPTDPVLLLAVLRGPLFGVSDDALFHFRRRFGPLRIWNLPDMAEAGDREKPCLEALAMLAAFSGLVRRLPAAAALLEMLQQLGLVPYAARKENGSLRAGTLVKLVQRVLDHIPAGAGWPELRKLAERLVVQTDGLEAASLLAGTGNAVRIMNLHKAKGLEAPVVFLACPCDQSKHEPTEHVNRLEDPPQGYFTVTRRKGLYDTEKVAEPAGWAEKAAAESAYLAAEDDRLLYVAATRARQLLVVSTYKAAEDRDPWSPLSPALDHCPELDVETVYRATVSASESDELAGTADANGSRTAGMARTSAMAEAAAASEAIAPEHRRDGSSTEAKGLEGGLREPAQRIGGPDSSGGDPSGGDPSGDWQRWKAAAGTPGFARASVTERAKDVSAEALPRPAEGRGMAFGTVVHEALEAAGCGEPEERLNALIRCLAREHDMKEEWVEVAAGMVRRALDGDVWRRALSAKRRFHEFPFMLTETGTGGPTFLQGVVDLLFEEEDGWVIVDFKTDLLAEADLPAFIAHYGPQVAIYAEQLTKFGFPVKETGLYFLELDRYVRVSGV
jgi:ATP-dependent helicase/nuclease subunit A